MQIYSRACAWSMKIICLICRKKFYNVIFGWFSFVQMLKTSTSDHSAWTRRAPTSKPPPQRADFSDDDDDDLFAAPSYQESFGVALSSAFENLKTPSGTSKKGKKKKKKVVLFSTFSEQGSQHY